MKPKMPKTDSIQELATFWQHHDVTDFEDELEEVPGPVFQQAHVVASRGIGESALIHEWVKERLRHA